MPPHESDRNLLFAVLALQADCLTPARFVEACTLWATHKGTPIAELLVARGWIGADERADVERLLTRKLQKHAGDARAGLAEATSDHLVRQSPAAVPDPDVQATLAGSVAGHILVNTVPRGAPPAAGGNGPPEPGARRSAPPTTPPRRASGTPSPASTRPAGSAACGSPATRPMRFVRGRTLREAAAAYHQKRERGELGPLDRPELLTAFVGVCNAIAYAHSRGVIHRDLKPANVVLGEYGEVMVLDWGLAKEVRKPEPGSGNAGQKTTDASSAARSEHRLPSSEQTLEGQVLGTPAYMAPEQADGRLADIDARTDVYGLGAILYELLTGRPPFRGGDTADVLSRVRTLAPDRPRDVTPGTPPALDAVCLKALAKTPADRYPTAAAMAADVQRFLADEPTTAYREPLAVRAGRWAKRRRTLVTSLVAALAVAVPILLAAVVLLDRSESRERAAREKEEVARGEEQAAREREQVARERAETNYRRSLQAADALSEELARGIRPIAGTQTKTVIEILDRAKRISDDLLADPDAPAEARERKARLLVQFSKLYRETNRTAASRQAAEQAVELYDRLLTAKPGDRDLRLGRAKARARLGETLFHQKYSDEALAAFNASIAEFEAVGGEADPVAASEVLATAYTLAGNMLVDLGDHDAAAAHYRRGLDVRRKAKAASNGNPAVRASFAVSLERIGLFETRFRGNPGAIELLREARAEYEDLCKLDPWNATWHRGAAGRAHQPGPGHRGRRRGHRRAAPQPDGGGPVRRPRPGPPALAPRGVAAEVLPAPAATEKDPVP